MELPARWDLRLGSGDVVDEYLEEVFIDEMEYRLIAGSRLHGIFGEVLPRSKSLRDCVLAII